MEASVNFLRISLHLAKVHFKLKNEGTWLGIFWYLLNPILTFILLFLIFYDRVGQKIPFYPLYLFFGLIIFNFFQRTTSESLRAISANSSLVRSMSFPAETIIVSVILKTVFSHVFEILVFSVLCVFYGIGIAKLFLLYPVILLFLSVFSLGISFLLSSLQVYFSDLDNIWDFTSRLIWFTTPIFYAIGGQTRLQFINLANPMYYFISISRDAIIYSKPPEAWMVSGAVMFSCLALLFGLAVFHKLKPRFAEMV